MLTKFTIGVCFTSFYVQTADAFPPKKDHYELLVKLFIALRVRGITTG